MSLKSAVSYCRIDDSLTAGEAAMKEVISKMEGHKPDFLLLFATVGHDLDKLIQGIYSIAGNIPLAGCSGAGSITNLGCDEANHSFALMGLKSEQMEFHPFIIPGLSQEAEDVGEKIGTQLNSLKIAASDKKLLLLFPDGLTVNTDKLFRGISSKFSNHVDFIGGTASNDFHAPKTYQFCNQEILSDAVSGVLITGEFDYIIGISHGCKPIGNYRTITKAEDNIIYEIDQQPALDLLKSFIGSERFSDIVQVNVLGLGQSFAQADSDELIARAIMGFNEEQGSIQIGAKLTVGSQVRFTRRDRIKVRKSTQIVAQQVIDKLEHPQEATYFYFNCVGRGSYLFGDSDVDVKSLLEVLGQKNLIGFFTLGEIAPVRGENYFHNYTGVMVGIQ
ncbi:MAG: FIST N-terminal domain-containing protein [Coleofasciculaceae cyanobacterium]